MINFCKTRKLFSLSPLLFSLFSFTFCKAQDIRQLLPQSNEVKGWQLADTLKLYKGDELYTYMDGGAEIFMEYGFKQMVTGLYTDKANRQLQVEVYDMADSAAAYGAYTFYLNSDFKVTDIGQEAAFADYYYVARKGNTLVVVSAPAIDDTIKAVMAIFTKYICDSNLVQSAAPAIVQKAISSRLVQGTIKYIEGKVGLSNIFKFIPNNAFDFKQAISFELEQNRILLMSYSNSSEAAQALNLALERMRAATKETTFDIRETSFSYTDFKKRFIHCETFMNYLLVVISNAEVDISGIRLKVKDAFSQ